MNSSRFSSTRLTPTHAAASAGAHRRPAPGKLLRFRRRLARTRSSAGRNTSPGAPSPSRWARAPASLHMRNSTGVRKSFGASLHQAVRQCLRGLEEHHIVRAGSAPAAACSSAGAGCTRDSRWARRRSSARDTARCAGNEYTTRGGTGLVPCSPAICPTCYRTAPLRRPAAGGRTLLPPTAVFRRPDAASA